MPRSAREVLEDHLRLRRAGDLEQDLRRNYAEDVAVLTASGTAHGHDAIRETAALLFRAAPDSSFEYRATVADDRLALLEWSASGDGVRIVDGVDSYLIEDGLIRAQSIHYRVESTALALSADADGG